MWTGWKWPLECSATVDPTERNIFCSTRSLRDIYSGAWGGHAGKSGLREDFSLPSLQTSVPRVSTCKHACLCIYHICVCGMHANIYGICHIYVICHIYGMFFYLSIHIYIQPNIFIFAHAMIKVCLKNGYFLLLLFH